MERDFTADRPNKLWVADLTYVATGSGWVCVAFVLDVYSRMIIGWQASTRMFTDLALEAVGLALNNRPRKVLGWRTPAEVFAEQLGLLQQPGVATTG